MESVTLTADTLLLLQNVIKNKTELQVDQKTIEVFELLLATNLPFLQKINTEIMAILEDHKIDIIDIPNIVLLITDLTTLFTKDLKKAKVTQGDILHFITEFLVVIIKSDLVNFENEDIAIKMVSQSSRLVEKSLSLKKVYRCRFLCFA